MAAKRGPTSDLNHNNWDQEEEPEEAGQFKEANENELKNRVIKKAKRRITDSSEGTGAPTSIFQTCSFTGFGTATDANKSSLFSFLNKVPAASSTSSAPSTSNTPFAKIATPTASTALMKSETGNSFTFAKTEPSKDEAYYAKVIKLNQTFCDWIKKHVDEQPLCNLMSTFKDYESYWEQLKKEKETTVSPPPASTSTAATSSIFSNIKFNNSPPAPAGGFGSVPTSENKTDKSSLLNLGTTKPNGSTTAISPIKTASNGNGNLSLGTSNFMSAPKTDSPKAPFSFGIKTDDKPAGSLATAPSLSSTPFSFGLKKDAAATTVAPAFSFGVKTDDKPAGSGFSFTSGSTPFSFGNIKSPAATAAKNDNADGEENDDDDDEPPKVEIKEIVEEDAFYTKKCKVFLKKDNAYKDFGIAMLYLKPIQGSSKTQLLVRASALGKILINTMLAEGTPVQRVGKNNVMIIYPNADGETQTNLIRVKDASEADGLLETLNKHKK